MKLNGNQISIKTKARTSQAIPYSCPSMPTILNCITTFNLLKCIILDTFSCKLNGIVHLHSFILIHQTKFYVKNVHINKEIDAKQS